MEVAAEMFTTNDDLRTIVRALNARGDGQSDPSSDVNAAELARVADFLLGTNDAEGAIAFFDGWARPEDSGWFAPAVLTPHHNEYRADRLKEPHLDHESPVPAHFLTIRRGVHFVIPLALTLRGRLAASNVHDELLRLTRHYLDRALDEWGIGGRSGASFGRLVRSPVESKGTNR